MKKMLAFTSACLFIASVSLAGETTEADQKWLQVVEKKIASGQTEVSTPNKERVTLLKTWASSNGYSVQVNEAGANFRINVAKTVAQK